ncbi:MAG: GNAT family N-acetyltransferase [Chloroflexi bacterium]|jgi:mycothiol synthase|nr:GNAT family N-acetyltransferase [Chloroflexota bacterium]
MKLIEIKPADLPAILAILQEIDYDPHRDVAWLRDHTFNDPTCSPDLLLMVETEGEIAGLCFGCIRDQQGVIKLFGVRDRRRRMGIATALFNAIEERMKQRGVAQIIVGAVAPNYFFPGVDLMRTDAISFLMDRGYASDRQTRVDMQVDLLRAPLDTTEAVTRLAQQGITIRRAQPDEVEQVAAFAQDHFSPAWQQETVEAVHYQPTPLFIALDGERIVAFAVYDVTGAARFGPTGTLPEYRRRGIGQALLRLCLRDIRDRGESVADIGWVGPIGFYARAVGAEICRAFWVFTKSLTESASN